MKPIGICCGRSFFDRPSWADHQLRHRQDKAGNGPAPTPKKENVMHVNTKTKSQGEMVVVETEDDQFLGFVENQGDTVIVRTGRRGHPTILQRADIESILPAQGHPYVEYL